MVTAIVAICTLLILAFNSVLAWKAKKNMKEIHILVNNHADKQEERVEQLIKALEHAGIDVPDRL